MNMTRASTLVDTHVTVAPYRRATVAETQLRAGHTRPARVDPRVDTQMTSEFKGGENPDCTGRKSRSGENECVGN
jgi:hypothetical protein